MIKVKKYSSRKSKEILAYRKAAITLILTLSILILILLFGVQGLVQLASFLGSLRSASVPIEKTKEELLLPPRLAALPIATNSANISVSGFAENGSTVEIFLNDVLVGSTLVSKEGKFEISDIALEEGENKVYAFVRKNDKRSAASRTMHIIFKESPPKLEISSPADNTVISDKEGKAKIEGETDPEASLSINGHWVIVRKDGTFSFELSLAEGENKIEVVARDAAGNEVSKTLTVEYRP